MYARDSKLPALHCLRGAAFVSSLPFPMSCMGHKGLGIVLLAHYQRVNIEIDSLLRIGWFKN